MQIIEIKEPNERIFQDNEVAVGIDFGTTNSLIAISTQGKVKIIKNQENQELIPTTIDFENNNFLVGQNKGLRSIKRLFGKSFQEIMYNIVLFTLIKDYIDQNNKEFKLNFAGQLMKVSEIAAKIFSYLKLQAEKELLVKVTKAVITVPAHFNDKARAEIMLAAKKAGLEVLRLIAEPTAAAYAYGLNKKQNGCYLIYDLGGGTFDVSILNMQDGIFQVIATSGDNMLGGDDIDQIIAEYFCDRYKLPYNQEILLLAKKAKEILSSQDQFIYDQILLDKKTFERLILPLINSTINIVRNIIQEVTKPNIEGVILVGGSTRIPLIKKKLIESLNIPIFSDIDPDKAVACGAAMQAENLVSPNINSLLIDVVPLSLGIELYGGLVEKIIVRNTPLPISITKEFTTYADNQTAIKFHIVQGERELAKDCHSLAEFELKVPVKQAGNVRVQVTFSIDADGILSVFALEQNGENAEFVEINPIHNTSAENITAILEDAFTNVTEDYIVRLTQELILKAKKLICAIEQIIEETPNLIDTKKIIRIQQRIYNLKQAIVLKDRDLIMEHMSDIEKLTKNFVTDNLNLKLNNMLKGKDINDLKE